jgi:hypothetical protein
MKNQINYIESDDLIYYYYLGFTFWGNFAHKKLITFNLLNKILYKGSVWGGGCWGLSHKNNVARSNLGHKKGDSGQTWRACDTRRPKVGGPSAAPDWPD